MCQQKKARQSERAGEASKCPESSPTLIAQHPIPHDSSSHFLDRKLDLGERVVKMFFPAQANLTAWSNDGVGIGFHPGSQRLIGRERQRGMSMMERTK